MFYVSGAEINALNTDEKRAVRTLSNKCSRSSSGLTPLPAGARPHFIDHELERLLRSLPAIRPAVACERVLLAAAPPLRGDGYERQADRLVRSVGVRSRDSRRRHGQRRAESRFGALRHRHRDLPAHRAVTGEQGCRDPKLVALDPLGIP